MTDALRDGDRIRSFEEFRQAVEDIDAKYNGNWLRTEYNQAIAASQCGARWNEFKRNAKAMPMLQYQAVMDSNTREDHAKLNGVRKRVDDPFWDIYMPPNGWGCRCEVIQLPSSAAKETPSEKIIPPAVPKMFQINFGKRGIVFPQGHAYFKRLPKEYEYKLKESSRAEVRRILDNAEEYQRLKNDKNYTDVEFDWGTGGLKATHIRHEVHTAEKEGTFFKELTKDRKGLTSTQLEQSCQNILFSLGDSAVLCEEGVKNANGGVDTSLDLLLNRKRMDIRSVTIQTESYRNQLVKKNSQIGKFNSLPYVTEKADSICLYFHDPTMYDPEKVKEGIKKLKEIKYENEETGELKHITIHIKYVYCVINEGKGRKEVFDVE